MEFGEWVQNIRTSHGLDLRAFSEKTGVDASTINRTEHEETQATLLTAFRICEGMGVSLSTLLKELEGKQYSFLEKEKSVDTSILLKLSDVDKLISDFPFNRKSISLYLVDKFNEISDFLYKNDYRGASSRIFSEVYKGGFYDRRDIDKILFRLPLTNQLELRYPIRIGPDIIESVYEKHGALMLHDIETYISRKTKRSRLFIIDRVATGISLERLKLSEVLRMDDEFDEKGRLVGMYWEACRFYEMVNSVQFHSSYQLPLFVDESPTGNSPFKQEAWLLRLALSYITIFRWYQYLGKDFSIWPS